MESVTDLPRPSALLGAVTAALDAMHWLTPSDAGLVALAKRYAQEIDEDETGKALFLGPHLTNTLRALGGAPADRKALGVEEQVRGKLAQIRAARG